MTRCAPIRIGFAGRLNVILSGVWRAVNVRSRQLDVILSGAWRVFAPRAVEVIADELFSSVGTAKRQISSRQLLLLSSSVVAATQQSDLSSPVVLDRTVAVVNKHVILASDLDDEMRLSVLDPNLVGSKLTPRQALQDLISRTLIEQQMRQEDAQAIEPAQAEVDARMHQLRSELPACVHENCASDAGWNAFLSAHGLAPQHVEAYARYRIEILNFIERRFRQGIQISQEQIAAYYRDTLLPEYKPGRDSADARPGQLPLRIQEILLQQQVNQMFDTWLANAAPAG